MAHCCQPPTGLELGPHTVEKKIEFYLQRQLKYLGNMYLEFFIVTLHFTKKMTWCMVRSRCSHTLI